MEYIKLFEAFLNENVGNLEMKSIAKKIYLDVKKMGYKVNFKVDRDLVNNPLTDKERSSRSKARDAEFTRIGTTDRHKLDPKVIQQRTDDYGDSGKYGHERPDEEKADVYITFSDSMGKRDGSVSVKGLKEKSHAEELIKKYSTDMIGGEGETGHIKFSLKNSDKEERRKNATSTEFVGNKVKRAPDSTTNRRDFNKRDAIKHDRAKKVKDIKDDKGQFEYPDMRGKKTKTKTKTK